MRGYVKGREQNRKGAAEQKRGRGRFSCALEKNIDHGPFSLLILNCDYGTSPCASTSGFLLRNGQGGGDEDANVYFDSQLLARDNNYSNSSWTLTSSEIAAVPAPGTTLLFAIGLIGIAISRRRKSIAA